MSTLALMQEPFKCSLSTEVTSQHAKRNKTMKKEYIQPRMELIRTLMTAPLALSDPNIKVNDDDDEIPPGATQTKTNHYNVWDDDWSREEDSNRH